MTKRQGTVQTKPGGAARLWAANERMNQILIEHLDPAAWSAEPSEKVRSIAAIFAHVHNVRCKWVRLTAPELGVPRLLRRGQLTRDEVRAGLAESGARCAAMLAEALEGGGVKTFLRDGWAEAWPAGMEMVGYMVAHEAHHRGQVCLLAHQLGYKLPNKVTSRLWNWERIWRERGAVIGG